MDAFRDSTASLLHRVAQLERENFRLRRRERLRFRDRVFSIVRWLLQLLALFAMIALAIYAALFIGFLFCVFTGSSIP
jgi:hypothetical protein